MNSTTISMTNNKEFWKTTMQRMLEENPLLYQLLVVSESNDISTEDYSEGYKRGALLMYILLSNQGRSRRYE